MTIVATLTQLAEPWAHVYADSNTLSSIVRFVHVGSVVFAGGLALSADRDTLAALKAGAEQRPMQLRRLANVHRLVLSGLAAAALSGVLMFFADVKVMLGSPVFWLKLALLVMLSFNGALMNWTEAALARGRLVETRGWSRLGFTARASGLLWFALIGAGVALQNAA